MSKLVLNRDGGKTDEYGTHVVQQRLITGEVMEGLLVAANAAPDMGIRVQPGSMRIPTGTTPSNYWYEALVDTALPGELLTASTANATNPRRDLVVAYIDKSVSASTGVTNNSNNMLKLAIVTGTAAASPSDPNVSQIQASIGASNPYIILARLRISAGMTQITSSQIDDLRTIAGLSATQVSVPYMFSVYRTGAASYGTGTSKVSFDTEVLDTGNNYDAVTNFRFTAPVDGKYWFNAVAGVTLASGNVGATVLYKNGVLSKKGAQMVTSATFITLLPVSGLMPLVAGDVVEVYLTNGGPTASGVAGRDSCYFEGFFVSK